MNVVYESELVKTNPRAAATHVLLVGCGAYPHLAASGLALKSLTSPRASVAAMADWFLDGTKGKPPHEAFHNPDAPLGTLAVLASPAGKLTLPSGTELVTTAPSLEAIEDAYREWIARLGDNPENRGVFYFCGHGVGDGAEQVLVADDFGKNGATWRKTFHASNTFQASIRKTSASLFFFLDACMELSPDLLAQINVPLGLLDGSLMGPLKCTEWVVLRATTTNSLAHGAKDEVAYFTQALLEALRGYCGAHRPGTQRYEVTGSELREATGDLLVASTRAKGISQKLGFPQGEGRCNVPLHVLTKRPSVRLELDVAPRTFRDVADGFVQKSDATRDTQAMNIDTTATFVVPHGEWSYGARARDGSFPERLNERELLRRAVVTFCFDVEDE